MQNITNMSTQFKEYLLSFANFNNPIDQCPSSDKHNLE